MKVVQLDRKGVQLLHQYVRIFCTELIFFFVSLELNNFWKEFTRNQFTAQPKRDKHA